MTEQKAIDLTPIEIWANIFDWLLFDPVLFHPDPFHHGRNLHSALWQWDDLARAEMIERQRRVLRLVCRSWKALADSNHNQYWVGSLVQELSPLWKHATRLCILSCTVSSDPQYDCLYHGANTASDISLTTSLQHFPPETPLPVQILEISSELWNHVCDSLPTPTLRSIFSNVEAAHFRGVHLRTETLPDVFTSLTYLGLNLVAPAYYVETSFSIELPSLTTLALGADNAASCQLVDDWKLPQLRHLSFSLKRQHDIGVLSDFRIFERGWPLLLSCRINFHCVAIELPERFWDYLPALVYLGVTCLSIAGSQPPPVGHPIKIIGNIEENDDEDAHMYLIDYLDSCAKLDCVADIYSWDDAVLSHGSSEFHKEYDLIEGPASILSLHTYCVLRGWRFEDRHGRSLKEYMEQKAGDT